MYYTLEPDATSPAGPGLRIHIADVSATGAVTADRKLEFERSADDELNASWLPRGDGIVFETLEGIDHRLMVAGLAPGSTARDLGLKDTEALGYVLSPDGRQVIASTKVGGNDRQISVTDLETLHTTVIPARATTGRGSVPPRDLNDSALGSAQPSASQRWGLDRRRSRPHSSQNASHSGLGTPSQRSPRRRAGGCGRRHRRSAGGQGRDRGAPRSSGRAGSPPGSSPVSHRCPALPTSTLSPGCHRGGRTC